MLDVQDALDKERAQVEIFRLERIREILSRLDGATAAAAPAESELAELGALLADTGIVETRGSEVLRAVERRIEALKRA
jgi:hypothetical protein